MQIIPHQIVAHVGIGIGCSVQLAEPRCADDNWYVSPVTIRIDEHTVSVWCWQYDARVLADVWLTVLLPMSFRIGV